MSSSISSQKSRSSFLKEKNKNMVPTLQIHLDAFLNKLNYLKKHDENSYKKLKDSLSSQFKPNEFPIHLQNKNLVRQKYVSYSIPNKTQKLIEKDIWGPKEIIVLFNLINITTSLVADLGGTPSTQVKTLPSHNKAISWMTKNFPSAKKHVWFHMWNDNLGGGSRDALDGRAATSFLNKNWLDAIETNLKDLVEKFAVFGVMKKKGITFNYKEEKCTLGIIMRSICSDLTYNEVRRMFDLQPFSPDPYGYCNKSLQFVPIYRMKITFCYITEHGKVVEKNINFFKSKVDGFEERLKSFEKRGNNKEISGMGITDNLHSSGNIIIFEQGIIQETGLVMSSSVNALPAKSRKRKKSSSSSSSSSPSSSSKKRTKKNKLKKVEEDEEDEEVKYVKNHPFFNIQNHSIKKDYFEDYRKLNVSQRTNAELEKIIINHLLKKNMHLLGNINLYCILKDIKPRNLLLYSSSTFNDEVSGTIQI